MAEELLADWPTAADPVHRGHAERLPRVLEAKAKAEADGLDDDETATRDDGGLMADRPDEGGLHG